MDSVCVGGGRLRAYASPNENRPTTAMPFSTLLSQLSYWEWALTLRAVAQPAAFDCAPARAWMMNTYWPRDFGVKEKDCV